MTHKGGATTLRGEGGTAKISRAAYEKTRRLWTHGWESQGEAFVNAAAEAHRWIQDGTETGRHTKRKKMCWANDETYEDIVVDLAGLLMQAFGDIGNRSERYEVTCTLEDPGLFAGEQETLRQDGLNKERWVGALVAANPEFTAEDVSAGDNDQVLAALELAQHARRAVLVIPLFAGTTYRERITELGGHIVFLAPAGTWSFVPDSFWKEGTAKKHVGFIQHPVAVVVFEQNQDQPGSAEGWDESLLVRTLEAWWAGRALGNEATLARGKRSEEARGLASMVTVV